MYLLSANDLFSGKTVQALCWMLVHSLWIGLLLTVVTGVIVVATKKQTAHLRYNLLTGALFLFATAMAVSFLIEFRGIKDPVLQQAGVQTTTDANIIAAHLQSQEPPVAGPGFTASIIDFFNRYAGIIVMVWFIIIAFRCIRLAGGLYRLHRLKNDQLSSPGEEWISRLNNLSARLNIKKTVRFFQSGIAKVPMVVGHFKPVILFPIGVLASLPEDEVEAILVHELAHIRRKDYLVNMVQTLVEILFFFNPAVLWVSSLIRIERENCCDDIAVAQSSSKRNYINALVSFQEYHLGANAYAPALAGKKDHLLQRVKRMLHNNNKTLNTMEKTFLMLCLIITTSLSVIFSQAQSGKTKQSADQVKTDSIPSLLNRRFDAAQFKEGSTATYTEKIDGISHVLYVAKRDGVLYEIYDDVAAFKINGKAVPREQWGQYKALMNDIKKAQDIVTVPEAEKPDPVSTPGDITNEDPLEVNNTTTYLVDQYRIVTENGEIKEVYLKKNGSRMSNGFVAKNKRRFTDMINHQKDISTREAQQKLADLDAKNAEAARKLQQLDDERTNLDRNINQNIRVPEDKSKPVENAVTAVADQSRKVTIRKTVDDEKTRILTGITYSASNKPAYNTAYKDYSPSYDGNGNKFDLDKLTADFIDDLVKEKVIRNRDGLSYKMSSDELIVNGKTQPASLHKQLKDKYLKSPDWQLVYNWRM